MYKLKYLCVAVIFFILAGCVKETYNMKMLSKQTHLSPSLAISAVKGDVSLIDLAKPGDTVVYDQSKELHLIFKKDSVLDLKPTDFAKATIVKTSVIDPGFIDLNLKDVLSKITGDFLLANPVVRFNYTNSFPDSVKINLRLSGTRGVNTLNLNLAPIRLKKPNLPAEQVASGTYIIDKSNSNLPQVISMPPEIINYSGTVYLSATVKSGLDQTDALAASRIVASLEVDIPLEFKITNLQFADTVDNFLKNDSKNDNPIDPADFQYLKVLVTADNGFPVGATLRMSLYDSATKTIKSSVDAIDLLKAAPVDANGKSSGTTKTTTTVELTKDFFSNVNKADRIVFRFALNSSGNGSQVVKIFSDNRISFNAALIVKPDIDLK
jgi:hypothetical protein